MANEKLNDYIKKCIELGKQREEITNNLLGVGWSKEDIDASFSAVKEETSVPEVPTKEVAFEEPIDHFSNSLNNEINSIQEESNNLNENLKQEKSSINMRRKEVFKEERIIDDSEENNSKKIITPIVVVVVVLLIFSIAFAFIQKIGPFSSLEVEPEIVQENENVLPPEEEVVEEPEVVVTWNCGEELIDERDGKSYPTALIGSQCWTAKNMDYFTQNSWCYDDDELNCSIHGRLYSWESSLISCPPGWTLPTDDQFKELEAYLGMPQDQLDKNGYRGENIGSKLSKYTLNGNDQSGFNALMSGIRINDEYKYINSYVVFWLNSKIGNKAVIRTLHDKSSSIYRDTRPLDLGYTVRCIKKEMENGEETNSGELNNQKYADENGTIINSNFMLPLSLSSPRSDEDNITHVVIHSCSNTTEKKDNYYLLEEIIDTFLEENVSVHYLISRDGEIFKLVDEDRIAYHAGIGDLPGYPEYKDKLNNHSIGIEIFSIGTEEEMEEYISSAIYHSIPEDEKGYTDKQYEALNFLLPIIYERYNISIDRQHIIGHDEYSLGRKKDPGSLFDWSRIGF